MDFIKMRLLVCVSVLMCVFAQDCNVGGKRCADHEQCCGGCCFGGLCIDTYIPCTASLDVCDNHSCVDDENCVPYVPPKCSGCEPIPICTSSGI